MNPTHNQDRGYPEPAMTERNGWPIYAAWLATGMMVTQPAEPEQGYVVTEAGLQELAKTGGLEPTCTDVPAAVEAPGTAALVLRMAALYLERHGWIQGCYFDPSATVFTPAADVVGAIGMVCYGGPVEAPAQHFDDPGFLDFEEAVLHLDRYLLVHNVSESYEYNDAKGRRLEDILFVLREAAATPADELLGAIRAINDKNRLIAEQFGVTTDSAGQDGDVR